MNRGPLGPKRMCETPSCEILRLDYRARYSNGPEFRPLEIKERGSLLILVKLPNPQAFSPNPYKFSRLSGLRKYAALFNWLDWDSQSTQSAMLPPSPHAEVNHCNGLGSTIPLRGQSWKQFLDKSLGSLGKVEGRLSQTTMATSLGHIHFPE